MDGPKAGAKTKVAKEKDRDLEQRRAARRECRRRWRVENPDKWRECHRRVKRLKLPIIQGLRVELACAVCGWAEWPEGLCFHHLEDKRFGLNTQSLSRSWDSLLKEISKCVCLCCRCHSGVHAGVLKLDPIVCGTQAERRRLNESIVKRLVNNRSRL